MAIFFTSLFQHLVQLTRRVDGNNGECIDPERHEHEEYLAAFKRTMIEKLRICIERDLKHDPDGGKG